MPLPARGRALPRPTGAPCLPWRRSCGARLPSMAHASPDHGMRRRIGRREQAIAAAAAQRESARSASGTAKTPARFLASKTRAAALYSVPPAGRPGQFDHARGPPGRRPGRSPAGPLRPMPRVRPQRHLVTRPTSLSTAPSTVSSRLSSPPLSSRSSTPAIPCAGLSSSKTPAAPASTRSSSGSRGAASASTTSPGSSRMPRFNMPFELGLVSEHATVAIPHRGPSPAWCSTPIAPTTRSSCPILQARISSSTAIGPANGRRRSQPARCLPRRKRTASARSDRHHETLRGAQ